MGDPGRDTGAAWLVPFCRVYECGQLPGLSPARPSTLLSVSPLQTLRQAGAGRTCSRSQAWPRRGGAPSTASPAGLGAGAGLSPFPDRPDRFGQACSAPGMGLAGSREAATTQGTQQLAAPGLGAQQGCDLGTRQGTQSLCPGLAWLFRERELLGEACRKKISPRCETKPGQLQGKGRAELGAAGPGKG